jgi:hypothetical protein
VYVSTDTYVVIPPAGQAVSAHAYCEDGDAATGGSHYYLHGSVSHVSSSFPMLNDDDMPVGWTFYFDNDSDEEESVMIPMVVCLDLTP